MVYITGDTHADFNRFSTQNFPEQKEMTKDDFVIICGDFGGVWNYQVSTPSECYWLDWLSGKPFTLLFVDGNHENFDRLKRYPIVNFHGGKAHRISKKIYHLMRGYVFDFEGKKFFTFGGASSHDIKDGILDPGAYGSISELNRDYKRRVGRGEMIRVDHISWWADELPSSREMRRGIDNLKKVNFEVDYVITHCLPQSAESAAGFYDSDKLARYLDSLVSDYGLRFRRWYCGHYHREDTVLGKYIIKYEHIERIL